MKYKKWLVITLSISLSISLCIGGFNYSIDPLWTFRHSFEFNDIQRAFNERQQKTNYITFHEFNYNSLLLGSSRTTYINQNDFEGYTVYNYAVSQMSVQEYNDYIEYAKSVKGQDFETIIIGLDFFATSENRKLKEPTKYIRNTNGLFYRYKTLFSADTFKHSIKNIMAYLSDKKGYNASFVRYYNRENVASTYTINQEQTNQNIEHSIKKYKKKHYGVTYKYNESYIDILKEVKSNNPNTQFIVYTTPVTVPLFNVLIEEGRFSDYKRWLKEVVSIFDEAYNFMYVNSITENVSNYYDGDHFYPTVGTLIAHKIINVSDPNIPNDFGVIVTKENIDKHLKELEKSVLNQ